VASVLSFLIFLFNVIFLDSDYHEIRKKLELASQTHENGDIVVKNQTNPHPSTSHKFKDEKRISLFINEINEHNLKKDGQIVERQDPSEVGGNQSDAKAN